MVFRLDTRRQFGKMQANRAIPTRAAEHRGEVLIERACTSLAFVGITWLVIRRWFLVGHFPPGLDGAQWITLGRGFHGAGRSTEGAYAPLVPLLATTVDALTGPLPALRLIAVISGLALALAIWLLCSATLGPVWGLVAMCLSVPASALAEPVLYGGYPQQLALAGGIFALWAMWKLFASRDARYLWIVGLSSLLAASAHHIYFPLMMLTLLAAGILWRSEASSRQEWRLALPITLAFVPACAMFVGVAFQFVSAGYQAPLDASASGVWDAWSYGTREAPFIWLGLLALAAVILAARWRSRGHPAWLASTSLIVPAGLLFLFSGQPRLLPPVLIGTGLAIGLGMSELASVNRRFRPLILFAAVAVAATLVFSADRATVGFAEFYRVVDRSLVEAAAAISRDEGAGAIVVRQDRRGWPIGWWFEALTTRPVLVGSDPRWLGFPGERENARQAAALFDRELSGSAFAARASATGVGYLVVPKWDWIGWERWIDDPAMPISVLFDDDRYLVLRVNR